MKKVKFGDRVISVPDDTTDAEINALLQPKGSGFENLKSTAPEVKPLSETDAPYLGRLAANSLPAVGSFGGPGGTIAATGAKMFLKGAFPQIFGDAPENQPLEVAKDLTVNNLVPAGIGAGVGLVAKGLRALPATKLLRNFPAVRQGAAQEMTQQILSHYQQPESQILENAAGEASGKLGDLRAEVNLQSKLHPPTSVTNPQTGQQSVQFAPEVQAAMKELEDTFGKNEVGKKLVRLQRQIDAGVDVAGSQEYKQISTLALKDLTHTRNWKLVAGEQGVEDLALNRLFGAGFREGEALSAPKILQELGGKNKEVYGEAIRPETLSAVKDLVNEIHSQQVGHRVSDAVVRYSNGRLIWTAALAGGGLHGIMGLPGVTAAGVTVTNSLLARAMSNPETARVVVEALRTPAGSAKGQMISNVLSTVWKAGADLGTVPEK